MKTFKIARVNSKVHFVATNSQGAQLDMDGSASVGGENKGPTPMESVAMALAGCASIDIVAILQDKMRQPLEKLEATVDYEQVKDVPAVFDWLTINFILEGDIDKSKALRAAELSHEKYCSVSMMLRKAAKIGYTLTLNGEKIYG